MGPCADAPHGRRSHGWAGTAQAIGPAGHVLILFYHSDRISGARGALGIEFLIILGQSAIDAAERRGSPRSWTLGKDGRDAERVTTTLTKRQKAELERLAKAQGVKVAWLIRRAVEVYLEDAAGGPMLPLEGGEDVER